MLPQGRVIAYIAELHVCASALHVAMFVLKSSNVVVYTTSCIYARMYIHFEAL